MYVLIKQYMGGGFQYWTSYILRKTNSVDVHALLIKSHKSKLYVGSQREKYFQKENIFFVYINELNLI